MNRTLLFSIVAAIALSMSAPRHASAAPADVPALTAAPAVQASPASTPARAPLGNIGLLLVGAVAAGAAAKGRREPDDPTVEHISPGLDEERKRFGKYHGLDPWDDPALFVSEPGTGLVYDVRELPQTRPGYVQSPVTGKEFAIAPNVVAQAGKGGALREPAFDKEGKAQDVDSDATGTK
ncbi:MAG TPA: hypothetical protein VI670_27825 [Thermoanaerobaculia bacterium]|jgi:hypothetical protein